MIFSNYSRFTSIEILEKSEYSPKETTIQWMTIFSMRAGSFGFNPMTLLAGLQGTWPVVISYHASTIEFGRVLIWLYKYLALPFQFINVFAWLIFVFCPILTAICHMLDGLVSSSVKLIRYASMHYILVNFCIYHCLFN